MYKDTRSQQNKRDLLKELIKTNFKLKYNNSVLGLLWVLLKPLLSFTILFIVFTAFRGGEPSVTYAANLLLGIIIFTMVDDGIVLGMNALMDLSSVILKVDFPRQLAITSSLVMALINFLFNLLILIIITITTSTYPSLLGLMYFIGIIILLFVMLYSVALISSIMLVKFRDLTHIVELLMTLLFWGSGIIYNIEDMGGGRFHQFLMINPFSILIDASRKALIEGRFVHLTHFVIYWILTVFLFIGGMWYFKKNIKRVAENF